MNRLTKRSGLDPGFAYLDNRYCDPTVGAFLTVDPLVATTGTPYLYGVTPGSRTGCLLDHLEFTTAPVDP